MKWNCCLSIARITYKHCNYISTVQACRMNQIIKIPNVRHFSVFTKLYNQCQSTKSQNAASQTEWTEIYRFPYIIYGRLLNRFKLYQTVLAVAGVPASIVCLNNGILTPAFVNVFYVTAIISCSTLYFITNFLKKMVGIICIDKRSETVKIAHLTFWGLRKDIVVPINNIVPLIETGCKPKDVYMKLRRYDTEDTLHITLRFGKILKRKEFEIVFGSLELLYKL